MDEFIIGFGGLDAVKIYAHSIQEAVDTFARNEIRKGINITQRDFDRRPPIEARTESGKRKLFRIKVADIFSYTYDCSEVANV